MMINLKLKSQKGFTLVEMLVAVGLFSVITSFALGAVLTIFDSSSRARSSKTLVDNLNLTMEDIARTVRFGSDYHCTLELPLTNTRSCNTGAPTDTALAVNFQGRTVVYKLEGTAIKISDNGGSTYRNLTDPNVIVEYLRFYVLGTDKPPDAAQPYVMVVIKGHMGNKPTTQSEFTIETLLTQRRLDI